MIRLTIEDGDAGKLDLVLGQACQLLGQSGDALAESLVMAATLTLRRDGGYFHPIPDDNWTSASYEAVLTVDPQLTREFSDEVTGRIWQALAAVLSHHGRDDVLSLVIEPTARQVPAIAADWRALAAQAVTQAPGNQARRERAEGGHPGEDGLVFSSPAELAVYQVLKDLQHDSQRLNTFAVLPLPGARLRDSAVRTPDFVVIGNGRAAIIEVDGPHRPGPPRDRRRHLGQAALGRPEPRPGGPALARRPVLPA
jgi:hypothetical protein